MNRDLKPLVDAAQRTSMTPEEKEEQRRSFAFGNTAIENERITREMIESEAKRLRKEEPDGRGRSKTS